MLELYLSTLSWSLAALIIGILLGTLTGLIPGFHVNNVALILLALSPALLELGIPLYAVAAIIVSTGTVHTFLNYIPSALIGAPDGDTALSLLPGHRMLLTGHATRGVAWSARGSQLGMLLSLPLILRGRGRVFACIRSHLASAQRSSVTSEYGRPASASSRRSARSTRSRNA